MLAHFIEKGEFVPEFRIDLRIRFVAAGGDIEVMQDDLILQFCAFAQHNRDMPAIGLAAKALDIDMFERHAREHGDAMIALLAVECGVLIAESLEAFNRKSVVGAFGLLQAQYVRSRGF